MAGVQGTHRGDEGHPVTGVDRGSFAPQFRQSSGDDHELELVVLLGKVCSVDGNAPVRTSFTYALAASPMT